MYCSQQLYLHMGYIVIRDYYNGVRYKIELSFKDLHLVPNRALEPIEYGLQVVIWIYCPLVSFFVTFCGGSICFISILISSHNARKNCQVVVTKPCFRELNGIT